MTKNWILDGELNARLDLNDRGLAYGDGVFTTIAWRNDCIEFLSLHVQRLLNDTQQLNIKFCEKKLLNDLDVLKTYLINQGVSSGVFKIIITRGVSLRGYKYSSNNMATVLITHNNLPSHISDWIVNGINMRVCRHRILKDPFPGVKHLNRLQQVIARSEWDNQCGGVVIHEGLLLNENDFIIEAIAANIFWINKGILYVPSLSSQGVSGIMRESVLTCVKSLELKIKVGEFKFDKVFNAQEVFVTNSLLQVCGVNRLYQVDHDSNSDESFLQAYKQFENNYWTQKIKNLVSRSSSHNEYK